MVSETSKGFDAIVVGSGFGGSVVAARLTQKGMSVLVLERGPWWGPLHRDRPQEDRRELPRGVAGSRKLLRSLRIARNGTRRERVLNVDGLLEGHLFEHLNAITASGVGGGSHIYTNILEEPAAEFFEAYPDEITGSELHPYFERVRAMLRPAPVPELLDKDRVFAQALHAAGLPEPHRPDLAIAWGDPDRPETVINAAGVEQSTSTYRSDVFVGCDDGSKTTLDLTYVPVALQHGAVLRPLCEVLAVGEGDRGYWVRYRDHRSGQDVREKAPRLILAAGGLNTQRLLFDAREGHGALPRLPPRLGQRFSGNADLVALLWKTALDLDFSHGPAVGALSRITDPQGVHRFYLGELGPSAGALPLPKLLLRSVLRSTFLFCMGRDASSGTIGFDGTGLVTKVGRSLDPALYDEMEEAMRKVAEHYEPRRFIANVFSGRTRAGAFTVHPLGGCSIGNTPEDGVTDHRGEVFGYPGLFVADGSLYPRSPGIAPSMTIAALAERQAALMP